MRALVFFFPSSVFEDSGYNQLFLPLLLPPGSHRAAVTLATVSSCLPAVHCADCWPVWKAVKSFFAYCLWGVFKLPSMCSLHPWLLWSSQLQVWPWSSPVSVPRPTSILCLSLPCIWILQAEGPPTGTPFLSISPPGEYEIGFGLFPWQRCV